MNWNIDQSWTLFLDRDGVINKRLMGDYVKSVGEFELLDGVAEALGAAAQVFGRIVVVTNQQGIGKGIMTERNLSDIHAYCSELITRAGGRIDRYYFAPELAGTGVGLRKPETGMAMQAKQDFPEIAFERSVMVGDSDSDIQFGKNLGMKTVFVSHNKEKHESADLTVSSLYEGIKQLV
ncbi:MAG TPA: HAD-IIIA family hydrolase [Fluviicola sp.]|nr:HAD-IIIA family hydrolase [Fluviicola sp.]